MRHRLDQRPCGLVVGKRHAPPYLGATSVGVLNSHVPPSCSARCLMFAKPLLRVFRAGMPHPSSTTSTVKKSAGSHERSVVSVGVTHGVADRLSDYRFGVPGKVCTTMLIGPDMRNSTARLRLSDRSATSCSIRPRKVEPGSALADRKLFCGCRLSSPEDHRQCGKGVQRSQVIGSARWCPADPFRRRTGAG